MFRSFHRPNEMTDDAATQPALIPERANALASSGTSSAASMPNTSAFEIIDHKPTYSHDNDDAAEPEEQDDAKPEASSPTLSVQPDTLSESILDDLPVSPPISVASDDNDITTQHDSNSSKKRKPNTQHPDLKPPPKLSMTLYEPPQQNVVETVPDDGADSDVEDEETQKVLQEIFAFRLDDIKAEEPRPDAAVSPLFPHSTVQMPFEFPVGTPETAASNHQFNDVNVNPPEPPAHVDPPEPPVKRNKYLRTVLPVLYAVAAIAIIWGLNKVMIGVSETNDPTMVLPAKHEGPEGIVGNENTSENFGASKAAPSPTAFQSPTISLSSSSVVETEKPILVNIGLPDLSSNEAAIETDYFSPSSEENVIGDEPTPDVPEDKPDPPSPELSFWSKVESFVHTFWSKVESFVRSLISTVKGFNGSGWTDLPAVGLLVILGCFYALHSVFTSVKQSCFEDEVKQEGPAIWSGKRELGLLRGGGGGFEEFCNFLRHCDQTFSGKGRHSRAVPPSCPGLAYNTSAYEILTVEELREVGNFLGVPVMRASDIKAMLIGKIVPAYEALLTGFVIPEIKEVLKIKNVSPSWKDKKGDLVKLAVEAGF